MLKMNYYQNIVLKDRKYQPQFKIFRCKRHKISPSHFYEGFWKPPVSSCMGPGGSGADRAAGCSPMLDPWAKAERRERKGCGGSWLQTGLEPLCCLSAERLVQGYQQVARVWGQSKRLRLPLPPVCPQNGGSQPLSLQELISESDAMGVHIRLVVTNFLPCWETYIRFVIDSFV